MTTATLTLTDFLLARIAEDEAAARAAQVDAEYAHFGDTAAEAMLGLAESEGAQDVALHHFTRHDPARVLAECEAKRRIVSDPGFKEHGPPFGLSIFGARILGALAAVYSDHPDYRSEWAV